jgi:hypothetical protein
MEYRCLSAFIDIVISVSVMPPLENIDSLKTIINTHISYKAKMDQKNENVANT